MTGVGHIFSDCYIVNFFCASGSRMAVRRLSCRCNALFLRMANRNPACPCVALVIFVQILDLPAPALTKFPISLAVQEQRRSCSGN